MTRRKTLTLRIPPELWSFLKKRAVDHETSLNDVIVDRLIKFKDKCEKRLHSSDTVVS